MGPQESGTGAHQVTGGISHWGHGLLSPLHLSMLTDHPVLTQTISRSLALPQASQLTAILGSWLQLSRFSSYLLWCVKPEPMTHTKWSTARWWALGVSSLCSHTTFSHPPWMPPVVGTKFPNPRDFFQCLTPWLDPSQHMKILTMHIYSQTLQIRIQLSPGHRSLNAQGRGQGKYYFPRWSSLAEA